MPEILSDYPLQDYVDVFSPLPNYYQVLSVDLFEEDVALIEQMAEHQLWEAHARYAAWPGGAPRYVLDAIDAARLSLLDPDRKAAYDAQLERQLQLQPWVVELKMPAEDSALNCFFEGAGSRLANRRKSCRKQTRHKRRLGGVLAWIFFSVTMAAVAAAWTLDFNAVPNEQEPLPPKEQAAFAISPPANPQPDNKGSRQEKVDSANNKAFYPIPTPARQPVPEIMDAKERMLWQQSVMEARRSMADRDLATAWPCVEAAVAHAQTLCEKTEAERLRMLLKCLERFWGAVSHGVAGLETGEELVTDDRRLAVIDATAEKLTIRSDGANHTYRVRLLPVPLALAVVEQKIPESPVRKVFCGAFLAMDRDGNHEQARRLWQSALEAGLNIRALMEELPSPPANTHRSF